MSQKFENGVSHYESKHRTNKKTGKRLTDQEKIEIIDLKRSMNVSDQKIAQQYNVDRSTVSKIVSRYKNDTPNGGSTQNTSTNSPISSGPGRKRKMPTREEEMFAAKLKRVEDSLFDWHAKASDAKTPVSRDMLKQKALFLFGLLKEKDAAHAFNVSNEWLDNYCDRYQVLSSGDESNERSLFSFSCSFAIYCFVMLYLWSGDKIKSITH